MIIMLVSVLFVVKAQKKTPSCKVLTFTFFGAILEMLHLHFGKTLANKHLSIISSPYMDTNSLAANKHLF